MMSKLSENIIKSIKNPGAAWRYLRMRSKGLTYKFCYAVTGQRVTFGKNFRVEGKLTIKGPGRVVFGDNVTIGMHVTPWTQSENAIIQIGDRVYLNGTRFSCANKIEIKDDCIIAECRIRDNDSHGVHPRHRHITMSAPIIINENVWITPDCTILKGVVIGAGSTITTNSVVNSCVPQNCLWGGNPAVLVKMVDF